MSFFSSPKSTIKEGSGNFYQHAPQIRTRKYYAPRDRFEEVYFPYPSTEGLSYDETSWMSSLKSEIYELEMYLAQYSKGENKEDSKIKKTIEDIKFCLLSKRARLSRPDMTGFERADLCREAILHEYVTSRNINNCNSLKRPEGMAPPKTSIYFNWNTHEAVLPKESFAIYQPKPTVAEAEPAVVSTKPAEAKSTDNQTYASVDA